MLEESAVQANCSTEASLRPKSRSANGKEKVDQDAPCTTANTANPITSAESTFANRKSENESQSDTTEKTMKIIKPVNWLVRIKKEVVRIMFEAKLQKHENAPQMIQRQSSNGKYRDPNVQLAWTYYLAGFRQAEKVWDSMPDAPKNVQSDVTEWQDGQTDVEVAL